MKRSILLGIVGIAASVATSSYGQGAIQLSNYISSANIPSPVMWGPNTFGTVGTPVNLTGYTVGFYWASGNITGSVASDSSALGGHAFGTALPTDLNAAFALATGTAGSALLVDSSGGYSGAYNQGSTFNPGLGGGATITVMMIAYQTSAGSYAAAAYRGHSQAFVMTTAAGTAFPPLTGSSETDGGFDVMQVIPEPATMALGGLGLASLLLFRRKQA